MAQSITRDPQCSEDAITRVLTFQILSRTDGSRPDSIFKIELRYKLSDLNGSCSILPVDGYIQSKLKMAHYIMERWFQAPWSPVGGQCSRAEAYIVFCEPDANYICLSLCDKSSHNKGGRPSKKREVCAAACTRHAARKNICKQLVHNINDNFSKKERSFFPFRIR